MGAFRQARPLAEGQKSADVKHDFTIPPPLRQPRQLAEGVEFPERYADFSPSRHHLAEGVEFPEKNAGSRVLEPSFGGGDPPVGSATRLVTILNHAESAREPTCSEAQHKRRSALMKPRLLRFPAFLLGRSQSLSYRSAPPARSDLLLRTKPPAGATPNQGPTPRRRCRELAAVLA